MSHVRVTFLLFTLLCLLGCSEQKTVLPSTELTEEQKAAIRAEDAKVAEEESHGAKKR